MFPTRKLMNVLTVRMLLVPQLLQLRNRYYMFPKEARIPVGSPLGSLIAEVFMY